MLKRTREEYLKFFRDYNPSISEEDGKYIFFTIPTQHYLGDGDFFSGIDFLMDFIEDGGWKPSESHLSRFMSTLPIPDVPEDYEEIRVSDLEEYWHEHVLSPMIKKRGF